MMTTSSGDASACPSAARATCGMASMSGSWGRSTALTVSDVAPFLNRIALSFDPLATSAPRKPCAIAIVITKTATTMAMPPAVIAAVPLRTIIERRLYDPMSPISIDTPNARKRCFPAASASSVFLSGYLPQGVHDLQPRRRRRRNDRREDADERAEAQADEHVDVVDAEHRDEPAGETERFGVDDQARQQRAERAA